jgi:hypothetical protein
MNKLIVILFLSGLLFTTKSTAQSASIDKVISFNFKNLKAIQEDGIVKGYYFFYTIDKISKDESLYGLCIYDNNLKQTHYKEITKSNKIKLLDAKFNNDHFCFHFFDLNEKNYEFVIYNSELIEKGKFFLPIPKEIAEGMNDAAAMGYGNMFTQTHTVVSLSENGFGVYGYGFSSRKFEFTGYNNTGTEIWNATTGITDKKMYELLTFVGATNEFIIFDARFYKNMRKPDEGERSLIFFDTKSGKQTQKIAISNLKNTVSFNDLIITPEGYLLLGEYYNKETKQSGIALVNVLKNGIISSESYISLKEDAAKIIKDEKQFKLIEDKSVIIQKTLQLNNNKIFVIGELYDKKNIYDIVIYEIQNNILTNVFFMSKQKTNISSYINTVNGTAAVGMMLKMGLANNSDYCYTSLNSDKSGFTTVYCNYEKENNSGDYIIGTSSYTKNGNIVNDQVKLNTKPTNFTVLPAKPGYIAVFEYFKKEKRINIKFEKLNT